MLFDVFLAESFELFNDGWVASLEGDFARAHDARAAHEIMRP